MLVEKLKHNHFKVRSWTWEDYSELSSLLSSLPLSSDSMANSAAYFLHTGRDGLWSVERDDKIAFISKHPNVEGSILVFPAGGLEAVQLWEDICDIITKNNQPVSLARIVPELLESLAFSNRFKPIEELVLDWRFPVTILDTDLINSTEGREFKNFRTKLRKSQLLDEIRVVSSHMSQFSSWKEFASELVKNWAFSVSEQKNFDVSHLVSSNLSAFSVACRDIFELRAHLFIYKGKVIGIDLSEWPSFSKTINGIAMCVDRNHIGCSEYMHWWLCKNAFENGYNELNINGSETESLNQFRLKLRPKRQIELQTFEFLAG